MKINIPQAVKYFFSNPSLELVYMEAISNSIDAGATSIDINISIEEFNKPESLEIRIKDNGIGFTDERFKKFSKLMEVDEASHKGIGRLVFLSYFEKVDISSVFNHARRIFQYSNEFDEKSKVQKLDSSPRETTLEFSNYYLSKIATHDYLRPIALKKKILENFYPQLYLMKQEGKELTINISLNVREPDNRYEFYPDKQTIIINEINEMRVEPVDIALLDMFGEMSIHFSIKSIDFEKTIITALCIDGRTHKVDIISDENIPIGYEIIFLLYSNLFEGKIDATRQELTIDENTLKIIKKIFQKKVAEILEREIPVITENNKKTKVSLMDTYPHLLGYFEQESIGFIKRDVSIKLAQEKFFRAQKEVLEASSVSDEIYEKTLELSSRALTEYILYREVIIKKLKITNHENSEADIHKLIIPVRSKYHHSNFMSNLYTNNIWLLDDKYMTFNTILSDKVMSEVIKAITQDEDVEYDNTEADIAIIFSNNPDTTEKVDVVIVELKKRGLKLEENVKAIVQLQQRAIKLMKYYPNKIQRIWFYAIVEFNDELKLWLENNRFTELFSKDSLYYREDEIKLSLGAIEKCNMGIYVLSLDAFIKDAESKNFTFLKILKENFIKSIDDDIKV